MSLDSIYLDNHATTRCDPRVVEAMIPYFTEQFGNASSEGHDAGRMARNAVDSACETIAKAIGASASEIIFTSGATESNNLAIRGIAERPRQRANRLVTSAIEHPSVLVPPTRLESRTFGLVPVGVVPHGQPNAGVIDTGQFAESLDDDIFLASVMLANNEIGVIQPVTQLVQLCRERDIPFHTDATQAVGKIPVDVDELGVSMLSFTAHKLYGPKGIGALYVRKSPDGPRLASQISGGGQQKGRRAGTLNVAGIVGFAKAVELCMELMIDESTRLRALRNRLAEALTGRIVGCELCGPALDASDSHGQPLRLPHNLNVLIAGVDAQAVIAKLRDIALSSGAACSSVTPEPSHVMRALGLADDRILGSLRIGLGRFNSAEQIPVVVDRLVTAVAEVRKLAR